MTTGTCVVLMCVSARGCPWALAAVRSLSVVMEIPEDGKGGFFRERCILPTLLLALKICLPSMDIESSFSSSDVSGRQAELSFRLCV